MYLRWSSNFPDWVLDYNLIDDDGEAAWLPTDWLDNLDEYDFLASAAPPARTYIDEWRYGTLAGINNDLVRNLTITDLSPSHPPPPPSASPSPPPSASPSPPPSASGCISAPLGCQISLSGAKCTCKLIWEAGCSDPVRAELFCDGAASGR